MIKKQNVVFFVGAGFSAPFGLPVMANFIDKARDLYFSDTVKHKDIGETLKLINEFSNVKNSLNIDLHNIEDLLSIAYMDLLVSTNTKSIAQISKFIKDVIEAYTPNGFSAELEGFINLLANVKLTQGNEADRFGHRKMVYSGKMLEHTDFSIISLNYDLIIENALSRLASSWGSYYGTTKLENPFQKYFKTINCMHPKTDGVVMVKLHGSVDSTIIPPIWNKSVNADIEQDWRTASILLKDATHIFFLGYSLPSTDNYIRYLLANSLRENQKLKKIFVVLKDSDGKTVQRYKDLFPKRLTTHDCDIMRFLMYFKNKISQYDFDDFDNQFDHFLKKQ
jgi:SIR2-like domain